MHKPIYIIKPKMPLGNSLIAKAFDSIISEITVRIYTKLYSGFLYTLHRQYS